GRPPARSRLFDPATDGPWRGSLEGLATGSGVTVLAYGTDTVGAGPGLHVHPYDETFLVVQGRARFFVGNESIDAGAGEPGIEGAPGPRGSARAGALPAAAAFSAGTSCAGAPAAAPRRSTRRVRRAAAARAPARRC